jgi:hypothetical protein
VNQGAASLALAWGNQRILLWHFIAEADFAVFLLFLGLDFRDLCSVKGSGGFFEMVGVSEVESLVVVFELDDHEFYSSELDDVSRF